MGLVNSVAIKERKLRLTQGPEAEQEIDNYKLGSVHKIAGDPSREKELRVKRSPLTSSERTTDVLTSTLKTKKARVMSK